MHSIKEKLCFVSADYEDDMKKAETKNEVSYKLPDGRELLLGNELFIAPEAMFRPRTCKSGLNEKKHDDDRWGGIHRLIHKSVMECDAGIREELFGNILLSGGGTMYGGMKERLKGEMKALVANNTKIKVIAPPERRHSVWIGGAILSRLQNFETMWITVEEYDECGPTIVHRKCT